MLSRSVKQKRRMQARRATEILSTLQSYVDWDSYDYGYGCHRSTILAGVAELPELAAYLARFPATSDAFYRAAMFCGSDVVTALGHTTPWRILTMVV